MWLCFFEQRCSVLSWAASSRPPVWSRKAESAPADGGVGLKFTQTRPQWNSTENTDITAVGTSCLFQYSCLGVSQVSGWSRASNWLLNNKLVAVNQPITNKCHLVFSCTLTLLLFWGPSLSFCSLLLPDCSNSELCSLKRNHTRVYFGAVIQSFPKSLRLTNKFFGYLPTCQWCAFIFLCSVRIVTRNAETFLRG